MSDEVLFEGEEQPHLLLVDDDPTFTRVMARAMSRHMRSGFDAMMREAEMEEMQKLWAQQNEAIMKATSLPETAFLPDHVSCFAALRTLARKKIHL